MIFNSPQIPKEQNDEIQQYRASFSFPSKALCLIDQKIIIEPKYCSGYGGQQHRAGSKSNFLSLEAEVRPGDQVIRFRKVKKKFSS